MAILDPDEMGEIEYGKLNVTDSLFFGISLLYLQRIKELEEQVLELARREAELELENNALKGLGESQLRDTLKERDIRISDLEELVARLDAGEKI